MTIQTRGHCNFRLLIVIAHINAEENEIIIFTIRPTYNYWFDHKPEKLFPENNTNVIFLDLIKISKFLINFFRSERLIILLLPRLNAALNAL